jgi:hypothetical protein
MLGVSGLCGLVVAWLVATAAFDKDRGYWIALFILLIGVGAAVATLTVTDDHLTGGRTLRSDILGDLGRPWLDGKPVAALRT